MEGRHDGERVRREGLAHTAVIQVRPVDRGGQGMGGTETGRDQSLLVPEGTSPVGALQAIRTKAEHRATPMAAARVSAVGRRRRRHRIPSAFYLPLRDS